MAQLAKDEVPGPVGKLHLNPPTYLHHLHPRYRPRRRQGGQSRMKVLPAVCQQHLPYLLPRPTRIRKTVLAHKGPQNGFGNGPFDLVLLVVEDVVLGGVLDDVAGQEGGLVLGQQKGVFRH